MDTNYNLASNPWKYDSGATSTGEYSGLLYETGLSDAEILSKYGSNLSGGTHNAVTIDLGFLGLNKDFTAHFTYECGNDNLMGQGQTSLLLTYKLFKFC